MQKGQLIWITGFSGVGKTTIATSLYNRLKQKAKNWVLIDGDCVRKMCDYDLGYSLPERLQNAKRISGLCKLLTDQGINVVAATISMFSEIHEFNAKNIANHKVILIVADLEKIKQRDKKGLYKKDIGATKNIVGINQQYDFPPSISLTIDNNDDGNIEKKAEMILDLVKEC